MKNKIKYLGFTLCLLLGFAACQDNENWKVITDLQPGTYVTGSATVYSSLAPAAAFKQASIDPDTDERTGVTTLYTWLKADGELLIAKSDQSGTITEYGKGTVVSDVTNELAVGSAGFKVSVDGLYLLIYNEGLNQLSIIPATFGIIGGATPQGWGAESTLTDVVYNESNISVEMKGKFPLTIDMMKFRFSDDWGIEVPYDAASKIKIHTNMGSVEKENGDAKLGTAPISLKGGGKDIAVSSGAAYEVKLSLNLGTGKFSASIEETAVEPINVDRITPQVLKPVADFKVFEKGKHKLEWSALDLDGQGPLVVNYTIEMALPGTNFAKPKILFYKTNKTNDEVTGELFYGVIQELYPDYTFGMTAAIDIRIGASMAGVEGSFDSNVETVNVTVIEGEAPTTLYMIGADFGNWGWADAGVVEMIPVKDVTDAFWCINYFKAGNGFKWSPVKDWAGSFGQLTTNTGFTQSDDGNALVPTDGLYTVYIDQAAGKIAIEPALVYGIGDAFGGYTEKASPFTVSGNKASITTTVAGNLRMYAGSSIATTEWWSREFILRDGKIEYRGNGGDQKPDVAIEAGKTVTLDFKAGTGTIQ